MTIAGILLAQAWTAVIVVAGGAETEPNVQPSQTAPPRLLASVNPTAPEIILPLDRLQPDHPRLLLRPRATPHAIGLDQLRLDPGDADGQRLLRQLRGLDSAAAQAMVYLLTGDEKAADKAIARMCDIKGDGGRNPFRICYPLFEVSLAYDWLYGHPKFTEAIKAKVRENVAPRAQAGMRMCNDHVFHNYVWMTASGTALWALATAGDDPQSDQLYQRIRRRLNTGLFPAMEYLAGAPAESLSYWELHDFSPAVMVLLAAQSALETDLAAVIRERGNNWLSRQFENLIHSTLPNMRYLPWGDLVGGPNGGVTHEMAGTIDGLNWMLDSSQGVYFSRWLAGKRGTDRFYGDTAIFYFLYTPRLRAKPVPPPPAHVAGSAVGGHTIMRSGWDEGDTIVAFRCTDHYGDHNHFDQGSFLIYRNGPLAVDAGQYRSTRGPQQRTDNHNTLLFDGEGQRPVRGQDYSTLEAFQRDLHQRRNLDTGDLLFFRDTPDWSAVAGQFAQAYSREQHVASCVRQLLFVRPNRILVVDHLAASPGRSLPDVQWLLQTAGKPDVNGGLATTSNGKSWLTCRSLSPDSNAPNVEPSRDGAYRTAYRYAGKENLTLIHMLQTGDGAPGELRPAPTVNVTDTSVELTLDAGRFRLAREGRFEVSRVTDP